MGITGIRAVSTGKVGIYTGKQFGIMYFDRIEIKGNPVNWVKHMLISHPNKEARKALRAQVEVYAKQEGEWYPFQAGKRMGRTMFWRNALGYLNNIILKEDGHDEVA